MMMPSRSPTRMPSLLAHVLAGVMPVADDDAFDRRDDSVSYACGTVADDDAVAVADYDAVFFSRVQVEAERSPMMIPSALRSGTKGKNECECEYFRCVFHFCLLQSKLSKFFLKPALFVACTPSITMLVPLRTAPHVPCLNY